MSFIDNKSKIFTQIETNRAISQIIANKEKTIKGISNIIQQFSSIKDKSKNIIPFLLDMLKSLDGYQKIEEVFDKILLELGNIENKIKEIIFFEIKQNFVCNWTGVGLPQFMTQGWSIKVSSLDLTELLKINPNTQLGEFYYDNNFNKFLYEQVLQLPNTTSTWENFLEVRYLPNTDEFFFKVINTSTVDEFFTKFLNSINIFPKENIYSKFTDTVFGNIKNELNISSNKVNYDEKVDLIIEKLLSSDELFEIDDSFFSFSEEETVLNEQKTNQLLTGFANQVFCGIEELGLPLSSVTQSFLEIKNSPQYNEIKTQILRNVSEIVDDNDDISQVNKQTSKNWFIVEFLKGLPKILISFLITPKINFLFITGSKIINQYQDYNLIDFIKSNKKIFFSLTKSILKTVINFLYPIILKLIRKLVTRIISAKTKEKVRNQKLVYGSLTGLNKITDRVSDITNSFTDLSDNENSGGEVDTIKNLLTKLEIPDSPAPPVPSPLILGVAKKPGLSATKIASRIIERQSEAGIPSGTLPDGTVSPDEVMEVIRIEEIIKGILEDMKITVVLKPGVQSIGTGTGPTGPIVVNSNSINLGEGFALVQ
jgi:hypothetical protein